MHNKTFLDFTRRTDALATQLDVRLGDLPETIGISRASFFAYRGGKTRITNKAWNKLARAEREAGIAPPLAAQIAAARPADKTKLLSSASLPEIIALLPADAAHRLSGEILNSQIEAMEFQMRGFFLDAEALAELAAKKNPSRAELLLFARAVASGRQRAEETWRHLVGLFRHDLGLDKKRSPERRATRAKKKH